MKKTKSYLITSTIILLSIFVVYTLWLIAKPIPLEIQGEVEATQIKVASKLVGRIDSLPIRKGQEVECGDILFRIDSPEIEAKLTQAIAVKKAAEAQREKAYNGARTEDIQAAYNNWKKAEAASNFAQKTFARINNLFINGVVAEQKRDEINTQMLAAIETEKAAKSQYEKAVNGVQQEDKNAAKALVDQANGVLSEVTSYLNETIIKAPISGEIANILAEQGELVPAGFPIVTIVNLKDTWVTFNLREDLLADIKKGSTINASVPALSNKEIKLEITYINALGAYATWNATKTSGDFDMKTFEVHARPIEQNLELRPGMTVLVNWENVSKEHE
jgi:HlyD family secretion protein